MFLANKIKYIIILLIIIFISWYFIKITQNDNTVIKLDKINNIIIKSNIIQKNKALQDNVVIKKIQPYPTSHDDTSTSIKPIDMTINEIAILEELEKHKNEKGTIYEEGDIEEIINKQTPHLKEKQKNTLLIPISEEVLGNIEEVEGLSDTSSDDNTPLESDDIDPR